MILKLKLVPNPHGGKRKGCGRKSRFKEPTAPVTFRCPVSKLPKFKMSVNKILITYERVRRSK